MTSTPPDRPRRVLVASGTPDLTNTLLTLLALWGHLAESAPDGRAALRVARTFRPEAALLGLGLAELGGCALARRLRRLPELDGVLLIALTGDGSDRAGARCRAAGFDGRLVVPFDPEELRGLLARGTTRPLPA